MSAEQHYVDSHGQSEVAFGLCHLLGYDLCPRLKPIHRQKVYLPFSAHAEQYPGLKPVLAGAIGCDLIAQQYDELVLNVIKNGNSANMFIFYGGLSPLISQHVSPYGVFDLGLTTPLPLREPGLVA